MARLTTSFWHPVGRRRNSCWIVCKICWITTLPQWIGMDASETLEETLGQIGTPSLMFLLLASNLLEIVWRAEPSAMFTKSVASKLKMSGC
ncbi:hypothetical protein MSAN_02404800 [Mycena sanguinolenta]|uniref:Uncharacterized protein n=1 Tax=Mycena sanguinolenta TaxID=230812 RepID=A0A8H6X4L4_9AGAR|nr:hypothetical protein MSAN_02404800 [Mycena sanguinolenta]